MVVWGVSMDTVYSNTHISLPPLCTDMVHVDSMVLQRGVTTTAMARELPRLNLFPSFLHST